MAGVVNLYKLKKKLKKTQDKGILVVRFARINI